MARRWAHHDGFEVVHRLAGLYADDERDEWLVIDADHGSERGPGEYESYRLRGSAAARVALLNAHVRAGGRVVFWRSGWWCEGVPAAEQRPPLD